MPISPTPPSATNTSSSAIAIAINVPQWRRNRSALPRRSPPGGAITAPQDQPAFVVNRLKGAAQRIVPPSFTASGAPSPAARLSQAVADGGGSRAPPPNNSNSPKASRERREKRLRVHISPAIGKRRHRIGYPRGGGGARSPQCRSPGLDLPRGPLAASSRMPAIFCALEKHVVRPFQFANRSRPSDAFQAPLTPATARAVVLMALSSAKPAAKPRG